VIRVEGVPHAEREAEAEHGPDTFQVRRRPQTVGWPGLIPLGCSGTASQVPTPGPRFSRGRRWPLRDRDRGRQV